MPHQAPDPINAIYRELEAVLDGHRRRKVPEAMIYAAIARAARGSAVLARLSENMTAGGPERAAQPRKETRPWEEA